MRDPNQRVKVRLGFGRLRAELARLTKERDEARAALEAGA
jgi:hypothetical protein